MSNIVQNLHDVIYGRPLTLIREEVHIHFIFRCAEETSQISSNFEDTFLNKSNRIPVLPNIVFVQIVIEIQISYSILCSGYFSVEIKLC